MDHKYIIKTLKFLSNFIFPIGLTNRFGLYSEDVPVTLSKGDMAHIPYTSDDAVVNIYRMLEVDEIEMKLGSQSQSSYRCELRKDLFDKIFKMVSPKPSEQFVFLKKNEYYYYNVDKGIFETVTPLSIHFFSTYGSDLTKIPQDHWEDFFDDDIIIMNVFNDHYEPFKVSVYLKAKTSTSYINDTNSFKISKYPEYIRIQSQVEGTHDFVIQYQMPLESMYKVGDN